MPKNIGPFGQTILLLQCAAYDGEPRRVGGIRRGVRTVFRYTILEAAEFQIRVNPLNHGGGALYAPPPPLLFAFYSKLSWGTHTWKFLTLQAFLLQMPIWKKNKKFSFTPLSEHFEIWVWKPAIAERVNPDLELWSL